jgi:2-methylisocitrate lyase-like PEP mutase family enzyme
VPIMGDVYAVQPQPTWEELQVLGYAVAFYPGAAWTVANMATWDYLHDLRQRGVQALVDFQERTRGHPLASFRINDLLGFPALREREQRYLPAEQMAKYDRSSGVYTP